MLIEDERCNSSHYSSTEETEKERKKESFVALETQTLLGYHLGGECISVELREV
jgi:hypothetical protein